MPMTKKESLVGLNSVLDIGSVRLNRLLVFFQAPQNILCASRQELMRSSGIAERIAEKIISIKQDAIRREFVLAQKLGLKILTQDDAEYPQNLREIYDPPIVLYVKGELRKEDNLALGIVGSRHASFYGLASAEKIAGQLSLKGITIVSGLACGIDASAHKGALKAGGRTIAVIGSGFNNLYPPENRQLAQDICKKGAIISEFPLDSAPLKQNFPRRNRVISGLSKGVLVVEAAKTSGALITADFALEQGREVFAMPGKADSETSVGANDLIKEGAKLVTCAEDILDEFFAHLPLKKNIYCAKSAEGHLISEAEKGVLDKFLGRPLTIDELAKETNMDISKTSAILLRLQIKKLVKELPGKQYVRQ